MRRIVITVFFVFIVFLIVVVVVGVVVVVFVGDEKRREGDRRHTVSNQYLIK